jgi:protein Mpv17
MTQAIMSAVREMPPLDFPATEKQ